MTSARSLALDMSRSRKCFQGQDKTGYKEKQLAMSVSYGRRKTHTGGGIRFQARI